MAIALEKSNKRLLWSIPKPPSKDTHDPPTHYTKKETVLPDGFLTRVQGRGMVCGWAPQVEVLADVATKGFVSHCGWNSILEGLWQGDLGLGVDLCMTYRSGQSELVMADQIEKAINSLMDDENRVRNCVKEISDKSRNTLINGGSSFVTLQKLVEDMVHNVE